MNVTLTYKLPSTILCSLQGTSKLISAEASVSKDEEVMKFDAVTHSNQDKSNQELEDDEVKKFDEVPEDKSKHEPEDLDLEPMNEASLDEDELRGRIGRLRNMNDGKKTQGREIRDISTDVFEELLVLHNEVHMTPFHIQGVARRLHKIVLSAASAEDGTSSPHTRRLAVQGLKSGANKLKTHASEQAERHLALLDSTGVQHDDRHLLSTANIVGIAGFSILIVFLTVLLVSNIVIGATGGEPWPFLGIDNDYLNGAPGSSFDNILPCDKLPLASDELFGYRKNMSRVPFFSS